MWKEYSLGYIKNNKTTSISIMAAALISAMFLSLITGFFYNMWIDNIHQIVAEEGDWQGKLLGNITEENKQTIKNYSNVKDVIINETEDGTEVSIYFHDMGSIYEDMPKIAALVGKDASSIMYHDMLLSEYFIFAPEDESPPLLLAFYIFVMMLTCVSLILIIHNAFAVSMNARIHQLGILQSIGATPKQIRNCLVSEALALCLIPILVGILLGIGLCYGVTQFANGIIETYRGENVIFQYHAGLFVVAFVVTILTVLFSAWIPARRLSRMSPLQAIKGEEEQRVRKAKRFHMVSCLFGIEGELARKSLYARRKAFRTSSISLTLSILAFSIFLCFSTLSDISTKHTYFERYKDTWDLMVTVDNKNIEDLNILSEIQEINHLESCTAYQKSLVYTWISEGMVSSELSELGGIKAVAGSDVSAVEDKYLVEVPLVILNNQSFQRYCKEIGLTDNLAMEKGSITVNRIWDNVHSNFRYKEYVPFLAEIQDMNLILFQNKEAEDKSIELPILAYTENPPVLKEEYDNYALVQIISESTWKSLASDMKHTEQETYVNLLAKSDDSILPIQSSVKQLLSKEYSFEMENRVEEERFNDETKKGYMLLMGGICGLLSCIGLANVFSNTLGGLYQRKREFARYLSIGLSPQGIKKILLVEAIIIGGKPILVTIPLTIIFVAFAVTASYLNPMEFIKCMPIVPLLIFTALIFAVVGLAYYIGGRKICRSNLIELLKDDTFV